MLRTFGSLAVVAAALVARAPQDTPAGHFPTPAEGLSIRMEGSPTMDELLRELARVTGQHIHVPPQARATLAQTPVGLLGGVEVPPAHVHSFVESLLHQNGYVLAELRSSEPRLLAVYPIEGREAPPGSTWTPVPSERIARYADHPALLVQSLVDCSPLDARAVAMSLRSVWRQSRAYQGMDPIGDSSSVLLRGTGADVARLAAVIERAAASEAERRAAAPGEANEQADRPDEDR